MLHYNDPLVFNTIGGQFWILPSTETILMTVYRKRFAFIDATSKIIQGAYTLLDMGTSGEDSVTLEIWVITVVTTARLEAL